MTAENYILMSFQLRYILPCMLSSHKTVQFCRWMDGWTTRVLRHFKHTNSGYIVPEIV